MVPIVGGAATASAMNAGIANFQPTAPPTSITLEPITSARYYLSRFLHRIR